MIQGSIHHLRCLIRQKQIDLSTVWQLFLSRIRKDREAFEKNYELSSLGVTPTNSIICYSPNPTPCVKQPIHEDVLLNGIPITVKDNFCVDSRTWSMKTTCSSLMLNNFNAAYDAAVVSSLVNAGSFLIGKTNMDEFAMGCGSVDSTIHGPVNNPWSFNCKIPESKSDNHPIRLTAGGSSGGSAAAVSAGLCLAALASDTGGSTRLPASYCGVVGFKPTYGLLSRWGLIPLVNTLDVPAVIASCASDVASILSTWLDPHNPGARMHDPTCGLISNSILNKIHDQLMRIAVSDPTEINSTKTVRIGIPVEYHVPGLDPQICLVWDQIAGLLADKMSCSVQLVRLPHTPMATTVYSVLCSTEVASNMSRYDGLKYGYSTSNLSNPSTVCKSSLEAQFSQTRSQAFGEVVRSRILAGNFFLLRSQQNRHLDSARRLWRLIKQDYDEVFHSVDFLLTPVSPGLPLPIEEFQKLDNRTRTTLDDVCTVAVNLAGLPAVSFPASVSTSVGLPIGLQLIGPPLSDASLLSFLKAIETYINFKPLVDLKQLLDSV